MSIFQYSAVDNKGRVIRDKLEAASAGDAIAKIRSLGCFPTQVKEVGIRKKDKEVSDATGITSKKVSGVSISFGKVKSKDLTLFTRQLSTLQDAGLPIIRGLRILSSQMKGGLLKKTILKVIEDVEGGTHFPAPLQNTRGFSINSM